MEEDEEEGDTKVSIVLFPLLKSQSTLSNTWNVKSQPLKRD